MICCISRGKTNKNRENLNVFINLFSDITNFWIKYLGLLLLCLVIAALVITIMETRNTPNFVEIKEIVNKTDIQKFTEQIDSSHRYI